METIKAKVVMLPTKNDGKGIYQNPVPDINTLHYWHKKISNSYNAYHLYITTNESIEDGDWCHFDGIIGRYDASSKSIKNDKNEVVLKRISLCEKIVATTESLATKVLKADNEENVFGGYYYLENGRAEYITKKDFKKKFRLPKISKEFINEYCNRGGIDEVLIEIERYMGKLTIHVQNDPDTIWGGDLVDKRIKSNPDNTINILPIKNSWNREEVESLCEKAFNTQFGTGKYGFEEWFKQNLK